jgi:alpha-amylase/alpha-mannosidase (GH57 family)
MERYLCVHGHFYQPPRENPWLEAIEIQDSAYPYHDWNEKVTAECYAPNAASRIVDGEGRILDIVSNYARMSFNIGPTILSWLEGSSPEVYQAILEADRQSMKWRSGHGSAIAQAYNHIIMPLANVRDRRTQVVWGIKDFQHRFKRFPEGMWLPETAVDLQTLNILAEHKIKFTILAPRQASRVRKLGTARWKDVSGERIDPTRAYLCKLSSGKSIAIFFYDGPISRAVAFEKLLNRGEDFASRMVEGFSDARQWPQLLHIATDGETYGHHHTFGDMALAYALNHIETKGLARLTNYGEYLEKHPPTHEVQIIENSSWSCIHGIERWKGNCGCSSGGHPEWNQDWRRPLRNALDWLRDQVIPRYDKKAREYLKNPWTARDAYIEVILGRSMERIDAFLARHAVSGLTTQDKVTVLKLLEMQRHALMMYTSCGWFFDEISGIETVQVMQYAGRTLQLLRDVFGDDLEGVFKVRLAQAKSNLREQGNGAHIYDRFVKPAVLDLKRVGVHYAISSLFEEYADNTDIYAYTILREDNCKTEVGTTKLELGKICVTSQVLLETECLSYCVLYFGGHALNGGIRTFLGNNSYGSMNSEISAAFERGAFADIVRLMETHFGRHNYSLVDLFRDEQRRILTLLVKATLDDFAEAHRNIYENNRILMGFLKETGMPVPKAFLTAAGVVLNLELEKAFSGCELDVDRIQNILNDMKKWKVTVDPVGTELAVRRSLERIMEGLSDNPSDFALLSEVEKVLETIKLLPVTINYWQIQNVYYRMAKTTFREFLRRAKTADRDAQKWVEAFKYLGMLLFFNVSSVLPEDNEG